MTTEQRVRVDRLDYLLKKGKYGVAGKTLLYEDYYMLKNVLEVIENQERKIIKQQEKIEKRDKIIDLMAEFIFQNIDVEEDICNSAYIECKQETGQDITCINCIKQYFENKAKE